LKCRARKVYLRNDKFDPPSRRIIARLIRPMESHVEPSERGQFMKSDMSGMVGRLPVNLMTALVLSLEFPK
jgi:hypothetical protein